MKKAICLLLVILLFASFGCAGKAKKKSTGTTPQPGGELSYTSGPWSTVTEPPYTDPWGTNTEPPYTDPWGTNTEPPVVEITEPPVVIVTEPPAEPEPEYQPVFVSDPVLNPVTVDPITQNTTAIDRATFQTWNGTISEKKQKDNYTFTAQYAGTYRLDLSGIQSGTKVNLVVRDKNGEKVSSNTYLGNDSGLTLKDLPAGETYTISVEQNTDFGNYTLRLGMQKPAVDVSAFTVVTDSMEFKNQRNEYIFTPDVDGCYRFEFSNMMSDVSVDLYVMNSLNETVKSNTYLNNGEGVTVKDLKAGNEYRLSIRQKDNLGDYTLSIGKQKPTVDITNCSVLSDSIEYKNQRNEYTFTAPRDGTYRFDFSEMMSDVKLDIYVYDRLNSKVTSDTYVRNGDGLTFRNATGGEQYRIVVVYNEGYGSYKLSIGMQKETVSVGNRVIVSDRIGYQDQVNIYSFTATENGDVIVSMSGFNSGTKFELYVYNDYREKVASTRIYSNDDYLTIDDVSVGQHFTIEVHQYDNVDSYELKIG